MFGADTKASFTNFFQNDKIQFSQCTVQLIYIIVRLTNHITLVTSLSTVDLAPNFSESNYIYPYYKRYKLCSDSTNSYGVLKIIIQTFDENPRCTIIQLLAKFSGERGREGEKELNYEGKC